MSTTRQLHSQEYAASIVGDTKHLPTVQDYLIPIMEIANYLTAHDKSENEKYIRRQFINELMTHRYGWEARLQSELLNGGLGGQLTWTGEERIYNDHPKHLRRVDLWGMPKYWRGYGYSGQQSIGVELKCGHDNESNSCRQEFVKDIHKVLNFGVRADYVGRAWAKDWDEHVPVVAPRRVDRTAVICVAVTAREENLYNLQDDFEDEWSDQLKEKIAGVRVFHKKLYKKEVGLMDSDPDRAPMDLWVMWTVQMYY